MAAANVVPTPDFATYGFSVTPSDADDLAEYARGLWVGGAGNLRVTLTGGGTVTLVGVPAGTYLRICEKKIAATLTTATSIVGFR